MSESVQGAPVWLRDGEVSDLEAMYQLDVLCFEPPFRFSRAAMRSFSQARGAFTIVAEDRAGQLAGFIVVQVSRMRERREAYIVTLDVRAESRRGGVAGRLLKAAEVKAAKAGASKMGLHVWTENSAAVQFYESAGYDRMQLHPEFYAEGMDAFGYGREIGVAAPSDADEMASGRL